MKLGFKLNTIILSKLEIIIQELSVFDPFEQYCQYPLLRGGEGGYIGPTYISLFSTECYNFQSVCNAFPG